MARKPKVKAEVNTTGIVGSVTDVYLQDFAEEALREYGSHVVENRAIPDFRDGLKPVHRAILWSMYDLNLGHNKPYKKSARTVGECFVAGTMVTTSTGMKPIELMEVGDMVATSQGYKPVTDTFVIPKKGRPLLRVTLANGKSVVCTQDQEFKVYLPFVSGVAWVHAKDLTSAAYKVITDSGIAVSIASVNATEDAETYDIEVKDAHEFFANGILVHNCIGRWHPHGDCLRGDTLVPLLSGKLVTIKQLAEKGAKSRWVLSFDEKTKKLVPAKAHSWRVGQVSSVMYRIHLSTGDIIECTGNHQFYVKKKGWIKASDLHTSMEFVGGIWEKGDYDKIHYRDGFFHVHPHVARHCADGEIADDAVAHHLDENSRNNRPKNLKIISRAEHASIHEDYLLGLAKGRETMFGNKAYRKAIRKKNSTLMKLYNKNQGVIKAFSAVKRMRELGLRIDPATYESFRRTGEIYNLTTLDKLKEHGYTIERIVQEGDYRIDTSSATGHTAKLKTELDFVPSVSAVKPIDGNGLLHIKLADVFKYLLSHYTEDQLTWGKYLKAASAFELHGNNVAYVDKGRLQEIFNVSTIQELLHKVKANRLCSVTKVERIKLKQAEPFYDFTVDGLQNMIIVPPSQRGKKARNFVVAHNSSAYGAMVTIANTKIPLVDGYGAWGDHVDSAASPRYTEARLSKFSDTYLLDPDYLAVVPKVKNFSGDAEWPRFLPAKLPVQLLVGSPTIPAYGVRAGNPSFALDGVVKLVKAAIKGTVITPKHCAKYLQIDLRWGGNCISPEDEMLEFYETGKGNLMFEPDYELDYAKKEFRILSTCPGRFASQTTISSALIKIGELKGVTWVGDRTAKGVGKYNICYVAKFGRVSEIEMNDLSKEILKIVSGRGPYELGWTFRKAEETTFSKGGFHDFLNNWAKYRIGLEVAVIKRLIAEENKKLERQELLEWAVINRELVFEAVKSKKVHPVQYLSKQGKVSEEFAAEVLRLQILSLAGLDLIKIREKQKEIKAVIKALKDDLSNPTDRLIEQLDKIVL